MTLVKAVIFALPTTFAKMNKLLYNDEHCMFCLLLRRLWMDKLVKCDCRNFCISPVFHVFMRRQYYILPHDEVFMWNCVFSLYLAFFPGG